MKNKRLIMLKRLPARAVAAVLALACLVVVTAGCSDVSGEAAGTTSVAAADSTRIQVAVEGMYCTGCAGTIETTLAKLPGVQSCTASFEQGAATVLATAETDPDTIIRAIDDLGYHARLDDAAAVD